VHASLGSLLGLRLQARTATFGYPENEVVTRIKLARLMEIEDCFTGQEAASFELDESSAIVITTVYEPLPGSCQSKD
jgi:hypothetical protein